MPSAEDSNYNSHSGLAEDRLASGWPLGPRASARLDDDHSLGEAFLLAGLTVLQSRLFHQASVTIAAGHRVRTFPFAPDSPFSSILPTVSDDRTFLDVDEVLDNASAVDASLEVIFDGDAEALVPARAYPVFCAQRASQSGAWRISLRNVPHAEAERMLHYLATLLESAARDPHQAAGSLPMLSEAEALDLYRVINATEAPHQLELITDLITQQAQIDPSADAVVFDGVPLTYAALEDESSRLSIVLSRMGADQNHPVVLAMPRSQQVPIVLLAALKAGSFFVPLDSTHPQQRLADILDECKPAVVVVTPATEPLFVDKTLPILVLGGSAAETAVPLAPMTRSLDDKAYTIYTSGTTGKPKGVMVPQRALLNFVTAAQREPGLKRGDRMLAVATLSFDMSIMDMFLPLATGAAIVIASEQDARDPALLAQLIERERITCMQATPTTWRMLLSHGWRGKKCLRMLAGGEVLPRDLANDLIRLDVDPAGEGCGELWNCYGPTETTVYSSFLRIHAGDGLVPIGPPIANTTFYIADTDGKLLPPEVAGELYIGGDGVALGYFERPELNRQKFIANPWTGNTPQLLFRTGDRAQLRPDGNFDFFGRLDQQVKLRGYRIELGEIETVLRTYPSVADAAVVLREDATGEPWLVAYVISRGDFDAMALRAHAAKSLPDYMLPARFVLLPELPLTGSGKVDKRALQERPAPEEIATKTGAEKPADAVEAALLKVFREVLRSPSFGLDDSFFDHGGYSLLAVRLFARIANTLGTELPITALFDAPTVRALSVLLREGQSLATIVPLRAGGEKPPFFLVQSYLLYGLAGSMVPEAHPIFGLREAETLHGSSISLQERVTTCVEAIDRVYPRGLVHLGGWCAAATLTVEIARRLREQGRTIGMLALFDAEVPGFVPTPASGNPRLVRLNATLKYHVGRLARLNWQERLDYLLERSTQQAMQYMEWIYTRHRASIARLQRKMPFLPNVFFYNRWTQLRVEEHTHLRPIDAKVYLFRASDVVQIPRSDEALGWREIARAGVEVIFVPGHHESMFHEPHLRVLRDELEKAMLRSERVPAPPAPALSEEQDLAS